jgi:integration host factor subunit beta
MTLVNRQKHLAPGDITLAVKSVLDLLSGALASGERIEIRGFGSFSLHHRAARAGRNPKTGAALWVPGKYVPHFKVGSELRNRLKGVT